MGFYKRKRFGKKRKLTDKEAANRKTGKLAKANGAKAEAQILKAGRYYTSKSIMMVHKREESLSKKTGCDFSIFLYQGGAGFIEAKSRNAKSIPLNAVQEHQQAQLSEMERYGHIGMVAVRLCPSKETGEQHWYCVPFSEWKHESKKSLNMDDLEPYKLEWIQTGDGDCVLDLFSSISKHYKSKTIVEAVGPKAKTAEAKPKTKAKRKKKVTS